MNPTDRDYENPFVLLDTSDFDASAGRGTAGSPSAGGFENASSVALPLTERDGRGQTPSPPAGESPPQSSEPRP